MITLPPIPPAGSPHPDATEPMRNAAEELEVVFLSEMLKSAGLHKAPQSFGGGSGEDQFQSLLIRAQAEEMVKSGGIGLAESLFNALKEK